MRSAGGLLVSLALHALLAIVVVQALRVPVPFLGGWARAAAPAPAEQLVYVQPFPASGGGSSRAPAAEPAVTEPVPATPAVMPPLPPPPPSTAATPAGGEGSGDGGGSGTGRGAGTGPGTGPIAGLQPAYTDPRVWARPEPRRLPSTPAERIDSMIAADFGPLRDSIAAEGERRRPGDWTFERNGQRYGLDERYVHLGRFSLPTALLGMLPVKAQANPIAVERERRLADLSREVRDQAHRMRTDADFRDAVRSTRERKDRERAERRAQAARVAAEGAPRP